jgi:hypothetical protein
MHPSLELPPTVGALNSGFRGVVAQGVDALTSTIRVMPPVACGGVNEARGVRGGVQSGGGQSGGGAYGGVGDGQRMIHQSLGAE